MKRLIIAIVLLQVLMAGRLKAQIDPHFSQYYAYPLWLNPALTGVFDGDIRVNANYKNQWATVNNAYQTGGLSVDLRPSDKVGIGFNVIDQAAGSAGFNYFAAYGSFGYGISVSGDGYQKVHFGLQAGIINRSFDLNKLQFDNQYNPLQGFDSNLYDYEHFSTTGATVFDAGAGVYYFYSDPLNRANLFGGVSIAHLTQPKDPFATQGINSKLPMRFTIHGGLRIHAEEDIYLTPHFIYIRQQQNQEKDLGMYAEFKSTDNKALILGAMYRINDSAIADVGYHFNNMLLGLSYDFNTSALRTATNSEGGIELSLSYIFNQHSQNNDVVCPSF